MELTSVLFDEPESEIGVITLNRPEKLNAMTLTMVDELKAVFAHIRDMERVRVIILAGAGRGFCSGLDITSIMEHPDFGKVPIDVELSFMGVQKKYSDIIFQMRGLPQPIISAVQGPAAGVGMSMVLASDVIMAGPKASFIPAFVNLGLTGGDCGSSYFLPRHVGLNKATEILMTGRTVLAEEADRIGLVTRLVTHDALMDTALETARIMVGKSRLGLMLTKQVLNQNLTAPSLEAALDLEDRNQTLCNLTPEAQAGLEAFGNR